MYRSGIKATRSRAPTTGTATSSAASSVLHGTVTGSSIVGGLVGQNGSEFDQNKKNPRVEPFCRIVHSWAWVDVSMNDDEGAVGGPVGVNQGRITESLAVGDVTSTDDDDGDEVGVGGVGGLVGLLADGEIFDSYATGKVTGAKGAGGAGKCSEDMLKRSTYTDANWLVLTGASASDPPCGRSARACCARSSSGSRTRTCW